MSLVHAYLKYIKKSLSYFLMHRNIELESVRWNNCSRNTKPCIIHRDFITNFTCIFFHLFRNCAHICERACMRLFCDCKERWIKFISHLGATADATKTPLYFDHVIQASTLPLYTAISVLMHSALTLLALQVNVSKVYFEICFVLNNCDYYKTVWYSKIHMFMAWKICVFFHPGFRSTLLES